MSENQFFTDRLPFHLFLEKLEDAMMLIGGTEVLYANKKLQELVLSDNKLSFPCSLINLFHKNHLKQITTLIQDYNKNGSVTNNYIYTFSNKSLKISLSEINHQEQSYLLVTFREINPNKIPDINQSDYFSELFPFIMLETDSDGKILNCNHQFEQQLLYNQTDIETGLYLKNIVSPGNRPILESLFNNYSEFEQNESIELKLRKKFGENFPALMYFKSIVTKDKFEGLRCLLVDIYENKQIEYKFRQNQQRLRKVLDLVPHMIFLKDFNGNVLLANKASANFYETTTKNLVYSNIADFHKTTSELKQIIAEDKEVISTKQKREGKILFITNLDDNTRTFESTKVPFTDPVSGQIHSLGIFVDVTEQKRVEQEIKETKEKYRLLIERGSDGILILHDESIVFANRQAAKIFGQPISGFIGKPLSAFIRQGQLKKTVEEYAQNAQNKNIDNYYELKIYKPDGDIAYVEAKISTINYERKKSRLVFIRNITKRKIAEKRSERDKNMLEQAQKIAMLGSWEWHIQQKSFFCSDVIYRILEVDVNNVVKISPRWLARFIPSIEKKKLFNGFINSLRTGERYETEFPIVTSNGTRKIVHSQSQVFTDKYGKPEHVIGTWIDISERIRFEQMLKEAKLKAEESDNLKSAFLANMSHEIRTPMNAILGFANLLKKSDLDNQTRFDYIEHILQSGEGLIKLINDVVDISKIESNQLKIENSSIMLNDVLDQIYNRYEELLLLKNKSDIRLTIEKALPDQNFTIIADSFRLHQVISNLLNNAIKFTVEGEIRFGYTIVNSELRFFVHDQGIGIPDDKKEIIFKRFGKLEDPERMNKSGTGLGLSISKSLVSLMGGKIWLDSGSKGNTRFCFTIPLQLAKAKIVKKEDYANFQGREEIDLRSKTILIAEDELLNYKLLETLLKRTGAKVLWAKTGIEAVEIATLKNVDLVFMDIKMPEMNGYEATKAIKKINENIPIIAQTAFAFANERKYILQSGCDMYLTKPINHKEIFKVLQRFLS